MKRKRIYMVLVMLVCCVFMFAACKKSVGTPEDNAVTEEDTENKDTEENDDADTDDAENETTIESDAYTFGFSGINMENPYFITLEAATREVLEDKDYRMITEDPASSSDAQIRQLKEMADAGVKVVFLSPVDWEKITPALRYLKDKDVVIVNVDTQVKAMEYVDAYVGSDNKEAGAICGEDLIERRPYGGTVAILECSIQNSINERISGFEEALSSAASGFEVVDRQDTDGNFDKGLEAAKQILNNNPDVTAIMCGNDQLAVAAKTAANLVENSDVLIYGIDGSPDIKKELKKTGSQIMGTVAQSPINMGKDAARIGIAILKGKDYEKETYEEVFMINKKNVEMYGVDGWQ